MATSNSNRDTRKDPCSISKYKRQSTNQIKENEFINLNVKMNQN